MLKTWIVYQGKKLKLGLWVSVLTLALPQLSFSQTTTIKVKSERNPYELSISWIAYNNDTIARDVLNKGLQLVSETEAIQIKEFKLYIYQNRQIVEYFNIKGNTFTEEAILALKRIKTHEAIAITVTKITDKNNKAIRYHYPTFFFYVL